MDQAASHSRQKRITITEVYFVMTFSCPNSTTISERLSKQKRPNEIHNKAPPGQIQGDGKCPG